MPIDKGDFIQSVHSNRARRARLGLDPNGSQVIKCEHRSWCAFNRENAYNKVIKNISGSDVSGEELRNIVEGKLFDEILEENSLGGLIQDEISEQYIIGRIPCKFEDFVDRILNCAIVEEED